MRQDAEEARDRRNLPAQHQLINQGFESAYWPCCHADLAQPLTMFQRAQNMVGTAAKHSWRGCQAHDWDGDEVEFASYEADFAYTPGAKLVDS